MAQLWRFFLLLVLVALAAAKTGQEAIDDIVGDIERHEPIERSMPANGELEFGSGVNFDVPEGHICADRENQDCYPETFEPEDEFKEVRQGQHLPKGLHVRVNLDTGKREAKLYDPEEDKKEPPAIVAVGEVYDTPEEELAADTSDWYSNQAFEPVPPPKPKDTETLEKFRQILFSEKPSDSRINEALEGIEELSHDRGMGVAIAKDSYLLFNLINIIRDNTDASIRQKAAVVIGSSLANNPTAWNATRSHTSADSKRWPLVRKLTDTLAEEKSLKVKASVVFALKQVISRSRAARWYFIRDVNGYVALGGCLAPYLAEDYSDMERIPPSYQEVENASGTSSAPPTDSPIPRVRRERVKDYTPPETRHTPEERQHIADLDNLAHKIAVLVRDLLAWNRQFAPVPRHETPAKKEVRLTNEQEEMSENMAAVAEWNTVFNFVLDRTKGDPMSEAVWQIADISNELNYCKTHYKECWPGHDN